MPTDTSLLQAALIGYEAELKRIDAAIAEIRKKLGTRSPRQVGGSAGKGSRRPISAAAKKRIAAAQKKRWAAYRKAKKPA